MIYSPNDNITINIWNMTGGTFHFEIDIPNGVSLVDFIDSVDFNNFYLSIKHTDLGNVLEIEVTFNSLTSPSTNWCYMMNPRELDNVNSFIRFFEGYKR